MASSSVMRVKGMWGMYFGRTRRGLTPSLRSLSFHFETPADDKKIPRRPSHTLWQDLSLVIQSLGALYQLNGTTPMAMIMYLSSRTYIRFCSGNISNTLAQNIQNAGGFIHPSLLVDLGPFVLPFPPPLSPWAAGSTYPRGLGISGGGGAADPLDS